MRVFRVLRAAYAHAPFDGEAAYWYGGRWSSPGTRLAYASEHQSLAMLEYFVHLDPEDPPDHVVLATAEAPSRAARLLKSARYHLIGEMFLLRANWLRSAMSLRKKRRTVCCSSLPRWR